MLPIPVARRGLRGRAAGGTGSAARQCAKLAKTMATKGSEMKADARSKQWLEMLVRSRTEQIAELLFVLMLRAMGKDADKLVFQFNRETTSQSNRGWWS